MLTITHPPLTTPHESHHMLTITHPPLTTPHTHPSHLPPHPPPHHPSHLPPHHPSHSLHTNLQTGVTVICEQSSHDAQVTFHSGNMKGGLLPMVTHIEIGPLLRQQLHHFRFSTQSSVVNGEIPCRVLELRVQSSIRINYHV